MSDLGVPIVESPGLPIYPSDGEIARRIVRNGLADVLEWLGEPVGPGPDEPTMAMIVEGKLMVAPGYARVLKQQAYNKLFETEEEREARHAEKSARFHEIYSGGREVFHGTRTGRFQVTKPSLEEVERPTFWDRYAPEHGNWGKP